MLKNEKRTSRKLTAVLAGAAVLGVGAVATLATWNDSEWVNGLFETSSFEVEQNVVAPFDGADDWVNAETNPGQLVEFSLEAGALTPGDTVYGAVALRTAADSDAADLTLQGAVAAEGTTPDDALWQALDVRVTTSDTPITCDADGIDAGTEVASGKLATVAASATSQALAADSGSVQYYCFAISLPADLAGTTDVQGLSANPAWEFQAESV